MPGLALRVITFKASDDLIEAVDKLSKALGVDRSWLIRFALQQLLSHDLRELRKMTYNRYSIYNGGIDLLSRDVVCIDLTIDEVLKLKKISPDLRQSIKYLIEAIPYV